MSLHGGTGVSLVKVIGVSLGVEDSRESGRSGERSEFDGCLDERRRYLNGEHP